LEENWMTELEKGSTRALKGKGVYDVDTIYYFLFHALFQFVQVERGGYHCN
jgi:hypothetical protein